MSLRVEGGLFLFLFKYAGDCGLVLLGLQCAANKATRIFSCCQACNVYSKILGNDNVAT